MSMSFYIFDDFFQKDRGRSEGQQFFEAVKFGPNDYDVESVKVDQMVFVVVDDGFSRGVCGLRGDEVFVKEFGFSHIGSLSVDTTRLH